MSRGSWEADKQTLQHRLRQTEAKCRELTEALQATAADAERAAADDRSVCPCVACGCVDCVACCRRRRRHPTRCR